MSPWITKNGKHFFIPDRPRSSVKKSDVLNNRVTVRKFTPASDFAFAKMKSDSIGREYFEKAKTIIKTSAPIIASFDPHLATAYGLYRFGSYGFNFLSKVHQQYKITGSYETALRNVAGHELKQSILTKIKTDSIKNGAEYVGKGLWLNYKEIHPNEKIPEKLDKFAENALIQTFEEIGTTVF